MARSQPAAPRYMKMKPDEDHQERRRDQAAERTLRSLMTASANAQARIGALAEMYSREGRERTPEESAEMLALMRVQRARAADERAGRPVQLGRGHGQPAAGGAAEAVSPRGRGMVHV